MMWGEMSSGHFKARREESDEARQISKRPYLPPKVTRVDLTRVVQGGTPTRATDSGVSRQRQT